MAYADWAPERKELREETAKAEQPLTSSPRRENLLSQLQLDQGSNLAS